jgi:hypothetical protein
VQDILERDAAMSNRSDFLNAFAIGVRVSPGMRDRLILLLERCAALQTENGVLTAQCAELERRCDKLQQQTENESESEKFVDHRGAKFRRSPDGAVDARVYCPKCRNPMATPAEDFLPYRCAPCHYLSPLKGFDFPAVLDELAEPTMHDA